MFLPSLLHKQTDKNTIWTTDGEKLCMSKGPTRAGNPICYLHIMAHMDAVSKRLHIFKK